MERYKPEQQEETMNEELREFIHELSETTGEYLPVEYVDGTYEIEADGFTLTFTNKDEIFEIQHEGSGRRWAIKRETLRTSISVQRNRSNKTLTVALRGGFS